MPMQVADFKDFWAAAQAAGYEAYVAEPPETDPQVRLGVAGPPSCAALLPCHSGCLLFVGWPAGLLGAGPPAMTADSRNCCHLPPLPPGLL